MGLYFSNVGVFSTVFVELYFSVVFWEGCNLCATLMPVERGGWDNKERYWFPLGDQHYGLEYNCGPGTAIYAPFQEQGSESEKYHFVFLF